MNRPQGCRVVIQHHFIIGDCGKGMAHAAGSDAFAQKGRFSSLDQACTEREENKKKEEKAGRTKGRRRNKKTEEGRIRRRRKKEEDRRRKP